VAGGACLLAGTARAALPDRAKPSGQRRRPDRAYTFRELLDRADLIAVGEIVAPEGSKKGAPQEVGLIRISEVLKGEPPPGSPGDGSAISSERPGEERVRFRVEGPALPAGAEAIWFFPRAGADGVYVVDHPQCAYDVTHRTLVKIGIETPERIRPRYYLRRADEKLAESIHRAKDRLALARVPPGPSAEGLRLAFRTTSPKSRAGRALLGRFTLTNGGEKPVLVCDSAQECYFVVAERRAAETTAPDGDTQDGREGRRGLVHPVDPRESSSEVAKAGAPEIGGLSGLGIGLLISEHDFTKLAPGESVTRSLTISPERLAALREPGKVSMRGAYLYRRPEAPLVDLPPDAWEGIVASPPVELEVQPPLGR
jgi:hypothetical protein